MLACIVVTLACRATGYLPTWAIVFLVTTLPVAILWAISNGRLVWPRMHFAPNVRTLASAARSVALNDRFRWEDVEVYSAHPASAIQTGTPRSNVLLRMLFEPRPPTCRRTHMYALPLPLVVTQAARHLLATLRTSKRYAPVLGPCASRTRTRAMLGRLTLAACKLFATNGANFVQPCGSAPALFRTMSFRFVAIGRWVVPKFLATLRAYGGCFLHRCAFRSTNVSTVIITQTY
jgi:hypothetical protein